MLELSSRAVSLSALCVAVLFLTGCPPRRIDFGTRGEVTDPEALLKLIEAQEQRVATLSGDAKLKVDTPEGKGSVGMFVALSRPALVHLALFDFFNRPQAMLVVQGDRFGLYQAEGNRYYRGPASPQNVSRFLPVVLSAPELTQIMLGATPRIPHERLELQSSDECHCYVLKLHRGAVTQTLEVHPRTYRVQKSTITGAPAYDLEFEDIADYAELAFPRRILLKAPHANVEVELKYSDVKLNEAPDLTLFDLEPPEGVEVIEVDPSGVPTEGGPPPPSAPELVPEPAPAT